MVKVKEQFQRVRHLPASKTQTLISTGIQVSLQFCSKNMRCLSKQNLEKQSNTLGCESENKMRCGLLHDKANARAILARSRCTTCRRQPGDELHTGVDAFLNIAVPIVQNMSKQNEVFVNPQMVQKCLTAQQPNNT